jgi:hypothetical protein
MKKISKISIRSKRLLLVSQALLLAVLGLLPFILNKADAAQITARSVTLSSAKPSQTNVSYAWTFTINSATPIKGLKFVACDTAVGTYGLDASSTCASGSAPAGLSFSSGPAAFVSQSGFGDNGNSFARDGTGSTYCTPAANVLCASRATASTSETATSRTITFNGIANPSTANSTFFIGIYTYSATGSSTALDAGTVASAVTQTLTVNAAVAEVLNFCVGSTTVNDATTSVGADCAAVGGTSLNIGTLDTGSVNVSPVSTNGGDNKNGVAMIRTNAASGATVSYDAIQQSGTNHLGTLRISGASCNAGTVATDQCINAAGTTQAAFTAGTENFGMTIGGVNCGSTSSYTCVYSSASNNLQQSTDYVGGANSTTYGASAAKGFAWDETGTSRTIASSASSTTKVIDDEALILRFGATPSITTPFGAYAAQADFIAVPTY